jgi:hypothetical protein
LVLIAVVAGGPSSHVQQPALATLFNSNNNEGGGNNELASNSLGSRKRAREADVLVNQRQQQQQQHQLLNQQQGQSQLRQQQNQLLNVSDYQNHVTGGSVVMPPSTSVSTGLRLAFEDDRLNSTSSASASGRGGNGSSPLLSIMGGDLSTQIHQESEEIELLFKAQVNAASLISQFVFSQLNEKLAGCDLKRWCRVSIEFFHLNLVLGCC